MSFRRLNFKSDYYFEFRISNFEFRPHSTVFEDHPDQTDDPMTGVVLRHRSPYRLTAESYGTKHEADNVRPYEQRRPVTHDND